MRNTKRDVPVYLMTGFLESGKTTFIDDMAQQDYFRIPQSTLIINCESGEVEYSEGKLKKLKTFVLDVEDQESFTEAYLQKIEDEMKPGRVIIEYNPLWSVKALREWKLPAGWEIIQQIVVVDASTFDIYKNNMRPLFVEMSQNADLVMFNRCTEDMPLADYRRSIKVVNPACDVAFEGTDRQMINLFEDGVPYDLDADPIEIEDMDYGIFYVDLRDNPDRYRGKTVKFRGRVMKSQKFLKQEYVVGRMAMTCCADDTTFIGYVCMGGQPGEFETGDYAEVTAEVDWKFRKEYRGRGPVFRVKELKHSPAIENDMVYFN